MSAPTPAETYELLRTLTTPVVAVTARRGDKLNGMITDGATRAGIVPEIPRLVVQIHKFNFSHAMIHESGRFAVHVLHAGQVGIVGALGFESGRDRDKLAAVPHRIGPLDLPILEDCFAWFACEVINAMDAGWSTFFLGEARAVGRGSGTAPLTPATLREGLPPHRAAEYVERLQAAQDRARALAHPINREPWTRA
jgi:flavin reductase (DIM6/NTAB) family NADH-FMN oxidoreductase RutF